MCEEMTIDDVLNVASVESDLLAHDENEDVRGLARATRVLVCHIGELARELERERARRHGMGRAVARFSDGRPLFEGTDGGGRRDFLAGRPVHAGQTLYLLTCAGWQAVRYESTMTRKEAVLYLRLPGVRDDVFMALPREARFAWPDELRGDTPC